MSEPTTGKITEAIRDEGPDGTVTTQHGEFQRWLVAIDAGNKTVKASILRKPESPSPFGQAAEYVNNRWKLAPPPQGNGFKGGGASKNFEADPKKLRAENARSALHAAKDLVVAGKLDLDQLGKATATYYDYIESKAGVDGPVGGG